MRASDRCFASALLLSNDSYCTVATPITRFPRPTSYVQHVLVIPLGNMQQLGPPLKDAARHDCAP